MKIVIWTNEENNSCKLEQAFGHLANNILDAEEEVVVVTPIDLPKTIYKFEIDDFILCERVKSELGAHCRVRL